MTFEERSDLVLALARTLYVNGQSTDQIGDTLGLRARIMPRWGELQLQAEDGDAKLISVVAADPAGVDMDRVASAVRAIDDIRADRLAPAAAVEAVGAISRAPPAATWLFTLAAGQQEAPGALVPSPGSELDRKVPPRVRKLLPRNDQWKAPTPDLEGRRKRLREALGNTLPALASFDSPHSEAQSFFARQSLAGRPSARFAVPVRNPRPRGL
jgi:hypothetical protein